MNNCYPERRAEAILYHNNYDFFILKIIKPINAMINMTRKMPNPIPALKIPPMISQLEKVKRIRESNTAFKIV